MTTHKDILDIIILIIVISIQFILTSNLLGVLSKINIHEFVKKGCPMRSFCQKYHDKETYIHSKVCANCQYAIDRFRHENRKAENQTLYISMIPIIGLLMYIVIFIGALKHKEQMNEVAPKSITNFIARKLIRTKRT